MGWGPQVSPPQLTLRKEQPSLFPAGGHSFTAVFTFLGPRDIFAVESFPRTGQGRWHKNCRATSSKRGQCSTWREALYLQQVVSS